MSDRTEDILIIFAIIAGLFTVVGAIGWWARRTRERHYWMRFGPVGCPGCGTKYEPESDKGYREIDGPVCFCGRLFECRKCSQVAGFTASEGVWKNAEFAGYLKDGYVE